MPRKVKKNINKVKDEIKEKVKETKHKIKKSRGARSFGYFMSAVVMVVFIYIFNNLLNWHIGWLTDAFVAPLWIFNISFAATILANLFFMIYDGKWFRYLLQIILNIISLATIYILKIVFPFSVSDSTAHTVNLVLTILLICIVIGIVVDLIKFIVHFVRFISGGEDE